MLEKHLVVRGIMALSVNFENGFYKMYFHLRWVQWDQMYEQSEWNSCLYLRLNSSTGVNFSVCLPTIIFSIVAHSIRFCLKSFQSEAKTYRKSWFIQGQLHKSISVGQCESWNNWILSNHWNVDRKVKNLWFLLCFWPTHFDCFLWKRKQTLKGGNQVMNCNL